SFTKLMRALWIAGILARCAFTSSWNCGSVIITSAATWGVPVGATAFGARVNVEKIGASNTAAVPVAIAAVVGSVVGLMVAVAFGVTEGIRVSVGVAVSVGVSVGPGVSVGVIVGVRVLVGGVVAVGLSLGSTATVGSSPCGVLGWQAAI